MAEELESRDQPASFSLTIQFQPFFDNGGFGGFGSFQPFFNDAVFHGSSLSALVLFLSSLSRNADRGDLSDAPSIRLPITLPDGPADIADPAPREQPTAPVKTNPVTIDPRPTPTPTTTPASTPLASAGGGVPTPVVAFGRSAPIAVESSVGAATGAAAAAGSSTPAFGLLPSSTATAPAVAPTPVVNPQTAPVSAPVATSVEVRPVTAFPPVLTTVGSVINIRSELLVNPSAVAIAAVTAAELINVEVAPTPRLVEPELPAAPAGLSAVTIQVGEVPAAENAGELPAAVTTEAETGGMHWAWTAGAGLLVAAGGYWVASRTWFGRKVRALVRSAALAMLRWTEPPEPAPQP